MVNRQASYTLLTYYSLMLNRGEQSVKHQVSAYPQYSVFSYYAQVSFPHCVYLLFYQAKCYAILKRYEK